MLANVTTFKHATLKKNKEEVLKRFSCLILLPPMFPHCLARSVAVGQEAALPFFIYTPLFAASHSDRAQRAT